jgi:hypothetical protein
MVLTETDSSRPISRSRAGWEAAPGPSAPVRARGGPSEPAGPGSGARTKIADRALDYGDGEQVGMELELHVESLDRYHTTVADVDPAWPSGVWWFSPRAQVRLPQQRLFGGRGGGHHQVVTAPEGWPRDSPQESGHPAISVTPSGLPRTLSTGVSMTSVTIDSVRSFYSLRGRSHDRLARTACGSRSDSPATPALLSSGYLLAALALLVLALPVILGWLARAWVVAATGCPGGHWPRRAPSPGPGPAHHRPIRGPLATSWVPRPP